jgi:phage I-like protein
VRAGAGGGTGGSQPVKLSPDELAMTKRVGVTPEEYLKAKNRKQE